MAKIDPRPANKGRLENAHVVCALGTYILESVTKLAQRYCKYSSLKLVWRPKFGLNLFGIVRWTSLHPKRANRGPLGRNRSSHDPCGLGAQPCDPPWRHIFAGNAYNN